MKIDRIMISKRVRSVLICISVIMTNSTISAFALDNSVISPDIMCLPDLGVCVLSDVNKTKTISTVLYKQANVPAWSSDATYSPDDDNKVCGTGTLHYCTIGEVGCAIASFAMLTQTWRDTTSINYDPGHINTTVKNGLTSTWSFSPTAFDNYFTSVLQYDSVSSWYTTSSTNGLTTIDQVLTKIKPIIDQNKLVIVGGHYYTTNTDGSLKEHPHFAVIYGYKIRTIKYDDGSQEIIKTIYINDPGASRTTLSEFLITYTQIHRIYAFTRVN